MHSSGNYSGQLTIAAENDIIIDGNITRASSSADLLGLVANNFVRVKHPVCASNDLGCTSGTDPTAETRQGHDVQQRRQRHRLAARTRRSTPRSSRSTTRSSSTTTTAAAALGTLTVNGAIAQKFRGAVGTTGGTGYIKDYNYDDRLRYQEPPHFFDPVQSAWHVQRRPWAEPG